MAGFAAYIKVDGFNILPVMSFSMAATTFTGQNIGAGKIDRVKKGMWVTLCMGIVYTIVTGVLLLSFSHQIIGIIYKRCGCNLFWDIGNVVFLSVLFTAEHHA